VHLFCSPSDDRAVHNLGVSLNAARSRAPCGCRQRCMDVAIRLPVAESIESCLGDQAPIIGGSGWTSSAGPSCSGPSLALSWRAARLTALQAVRRVRTRQQVVMRHHRPARCLPPRIRRQPRPSRIQFPAGGRAPTSPRGQRSPAGIRAGNQLPGGRMFQASWCGCRQPTE
jgi:hypothetical protein